MSLVLNHSVRDLTIVLSELGELHDELATTIRSKLDAARRADIESMQACTAREGFLANRIRNRDGLRRQLVDRLGPELGLAASSSRTMPISAWVERLPESFREGLITAAETLRERVVAVGGLNRMAAHVTTEMLKHLRAATQSMTETQTETTGYSQTGRPATGPAVRVFDAVG